MKKQVLILLGICFLASQGLGLAQQTQDTMKVSQEWLDMQKVLELIEPSNLKKVDQNTTQSFIDFMNWRNTLYQTIQPEANIPPKSEKVVAPPKRNQRAY